MRCERAKASGLRKGMDNRWKNAIREDENLPERWEDSTRSRSCFKTKKFIT